MAKCQQHTFLRQLQSLDSLVNSEHKNDYEICFSEDYSDVNSKLPEFGLSVVLSEICVMEWLIWGTNTM